MNALIDTIQEPVGKTIQNPMEEIALEKFHIPSLFPWQRLVIANILDAFKNKNTLDLSSDLSEQIDTISHQIVLLPTGAGKSLCFMVPAQLLPGPTLILYPLLALMSDQERRMKEGGTPPVVFRGNQTKQEREDNFKRIKNGTKYILANPEVLQSKTLLEQLKKCNISHIAIDEAHCVSEWGDTFRPAYLTLGSILKKLTAPVVTAFTATASPSVLKRVSEVLFDGKAHIVQSESDRPNIHYYVKHACAKNYALLETVITEETPLVIFCSSRKRVQTIATFLREYFEMQGKKDFVRWYHAGLSKEEKTKTEKWFFPRTEGILVCTCAFGMGVDKKDIHTVIHYDPPPTAEAYIQEAGRGGRDNSIAKAILLWSPLDSEKAKKYAIGSREHVLAEFAMSTTCRRQVLLDAMGGEKVVCDGCDICKGTAYNKAKDAEELFYFIMKNRRCYTYIELVVKFMKYKNKQIFATFKTPIIENNDVQEILEGLKLKNKITTRHGLWNKKIDITTAEMIAHHKKQLQYSISFFQSLLTYQKKHQIKNFLLHLFEH